MRPNAFSRLTKSEPPILDFTPYIFCPYHANVISRTIISPSSSIPDRNAQEFMKANTAPQQPQIHQFQHRSKPLSQPQQPM
jgi:hypothetical protein